MNYYRTTKLNTLFKIWGIIIWVGAAIGALIGLIASIACFIAGAKASGTSWNAFGNYFGVDIAGSMVVIGIIVLIFVAASTVYSIFAGKSIYVERFTTPGARIVFAVLSFISGLFALIYAILLLKDGSALAGFVELLAMAWNIATGVFFILKYIYIAPENGRGSYNPPINKGMTQSGDSFNRGMIEDRTIADSSLQRPISYNNSGDVATVMGGYTTSGYGASTVAASLPAGRITGAFGEMTGRTVSINYGERCIVGRGSDCQIQLFNNAVSRRHCEIMFEGNGIYTVTDWSNNGTYANNTRLQHGIPTRLAADTLIVIGNPDNVLKLG